MFGAFSCVSVLFCLVLFFFLSVVMPAAAVCFCNCSLKASGEKAVLIVQITMSLNHRNRPK